MEKTNKIKAYSYVHMLGSDNLFIFVICPTSFKKKITCDVFSEDLNFDH